MKHQDKNIQYFYIVAYTIVGDDLTLCKVGLNAHQLIQWAKEEATKHDDRSYKLYKQPITRKGEITFADFITPFEEKQSTINTSNEEFDWGEFEANNGSDKDIDKGKNYPCQHV